ncbi:hypothetical protein [Microbacterium sp. 22242]|uniref:hypothetical protein n=1 Tax=Microbacterium sp. 22242 TaxID=3453896 RepID=UPI003F85256A
MADVLARRGRDRLIVPGYLCSSMIEPFVQRGWRISSLGINERLGVPLDASRVLQDVPERTVILLAAYFGSRPDPTHRALIEEAKARGIVVVEDTTHRVFEPDVLGADLSFASLRKLLPVGDGAYVSGDEEILEVASGLEESDSERWEAMDLKRATLDGDGSHGFREIFQRENERLEDQGRIRRATPRSIEALSTLPYDAMAKKRADNARTLRQLLADAGISVMRRNGDGIPSHLVLQLDAPPVLQARLAQRRVYCAIHWPRVQGVHGLGPWRSDLLSVPVDHRYGPKDMERVASAIVEEVSR